MKNFRLFMFFALISGCCLLSKSAFAEEKHLVIELSISDKAMLERIEIPSKGSILLNQKVWMSKSGILCKTNIYNIDSVQGTLECLTPSQYKAQISFDCSKNNNEANHAYLFFGLVGSTGDNQNFKLWCE